MQTDSQHMPYRKIIFLLPLFFLQCAWAQQQTKVLPLPTPSQLRWQQAEMGVLISYDLPVFLGRTYNQAVNRITPIPDANIFNPDALDTDQWIRAAAAAGARFAVLTVTHETGFALYQSDVNPYCMKAIRFQDGKGDVVRNFINSCRKYGLEPGLYVGVRWNSFWGVHDFKVEGTSQFAKNRQSAYKQMCEGMVRELCTRYGPLFMIWFDGGADDPTGNGPDVLPIVQQYQPQCLFYHNAQRADFRWGGSESGTVPYPSWATFPYPYSHAKNQSLIFANNFQLLKQGDADGAYWMPAMSDAPLRGSKGGHDWFWNPNEDHHVSPLTTLMKMYVESVGHNSTLIVGITPDNRGLIPSADEERLREWGDSIRARFGKPLAAWHTGDKDYQISNPEGKAFTAIVVQEDIAAGERVRSFVIEEKIGRQWVKLVEGTCIGHKYIHLLPKVSTAKQLRLRVLTSQGPLQLKHFAVY